MLNKNDLLEILQQIIFMFIVAVVGVGGMLWGLNAGWNEWVAYLMPLSFSIVLGFLVVGLFSFICSKF